MSKANLILLGLAVVQIVLVLVTGGDGGGGASGGGPAAGEKPYTAIDAANVGKIEITDDEKTVAVERVAGTEGKEDTWGLTSKEGYPVKSTEVTTVTGAVNKLVRGRSVTRHKKNHTNLQVSDSRFSRHVVVKDKSGGTLADFYLGEGKSSEGMFFRKAGEDTAYHASGANAYEFSTSPSSWVDTTFTDIPFDDVVKVKLEREAGTIEFAKVERPKGGAAPAPAATEPPKEGEPKPPETPKEGEKPADPPKEGEAKPADAPKEGEAAAKPPEAPKVETETVWTLTFPEAKDLDKSKVESLVRSLGRIYMGDPVGKEEKEEYGFAKPTATATITLKDGAVRTVTVGKKREKESDYYARRSGFDFIVTLRSYTVDDSFLKKLDDLLPPKPEEKKDGDKPADEPKDGGGHEGHDHK